MSITTPRPAEPTAIEEQGASRARGFDYQKVIDSPAFWPGVVVAIGIILLYRPLIVSLWDLWSGGDGYYSHGFLVPLISGYVIYRWWPRISETKVQPAYLAAIPLALFTYVAYKANLAQINLIMAVCLIASILAAIAFVGGWRWMLALSPSTLYLAFALPFWNSAIDAYTNPLQQASTKVAYAILKLTGFSPYMQDTTTIDLNHFVLDVGVPCSGLKLVLALTAFVTFFLLIARLKWWSNLAMIAIVLPFTLAMNGFRISMIGMVGDTWGPDAGHAFHDYSGYLTLLICFFILFKIARWLGWKD